MGNEQSQELQAWVRRWQIVGPRLAELRRQELSQIDTQQALLNLADAFESCRMRFRPTPTSGLITQQALFKRAHG
jgi:hypothetical protein